MADDTLIVRLTPIGPGLPAEIRFRKVLKGVLRAAGELDAGRSACPNCGASVPSYYRVNEACWDCARLAGDGRRLTATTPTPKRLAGITRRVLVRAAF